MNTVIHSLNTPNSGRNKNSALYCLTLLSLSLIGLTVSAGYQIVELIPLKATVHQQARELTESAERIKKLRDENLTLSSQRVSLETELATAVKRASELEALEVERQNQQSDDDSATEESDNGLCAIIVENIRQVENQLNRDDFLRLRDEREAEAEAVLEVYEKELTACLARSVEKSSHSADEPNPIQVQDSPAQ
ncbi:hypothetical protein [Pseudomonas sp. A34-9]|uniref:hypothetical protein n=1 Tax=Pseudomonas sp. A34-9 TaxID=3034675 RepID=UPI00240D9669|nr:hypothetical protein [Pseudomonas sp. A34-9]